MKRVAALLGKIPDQQEFTQNSKVPANQIRVNFRSYSNLLTASGLIEESNDIEKRLKRESAKYRPTVLASEKFEKEIKPYCSNYEKESKKTRTIMIRSDDHANWVDPYCDWVFWDVAERIQPDTIVFDGDTVDFYEISSFSKDPSRQFSIQQEIDFVCEKFFKRAREVCPNAQIDWVLGNHEWRLFKYLTNVAPGLSSLRGLSFSELFRLKEFNINLIARESFVTARHTKDLENYKVYNDVFVVTHGTKCGRFPASKELESYGKSGISGHVHRYSFHSKRTLYGYNFWSSNGSMCLLKNGQDYIPDLIDWTQGFSIIHIEGRAVFREYVDLTPGMACVGGIYYRRKG